MHHKENEEILDDFALEVKKIEEEAENILKDAAVKKDEAIANAKAESVSLIAKRQSELEKKKDEKVQKQKEKIDEEKKDILSKGAKELEALDKKSRKNLGKAADFLMKKLEKKIGEL